VVSFPSFIQNMILKHYCFLKVIEVDDDYDYDDDFNDDDLLMMMNSYMQSNNDIDNERMYEK